MVPKTLAAYPPAAQEILNTVRPGLTGVVSIVFRDEESLLDGRPDPAAFYRNEIIPYKAALECWYVDYQGLRTYAEVIALTLWAVIFKNTRLPWRIWKNLPEPPAVLRRTEGD